jgi:hypothetical protein
LGLDRDLPETARLGQPRKDYPVASGMKLWGNVAAILVLLVGLLWTLQGAGVIGGSVMSGVSFWLYAGLVMMAAAIGGFCWVNFRGTREL